MLDDVHKSGTRASCKTFISISFVILYLMYVSYHGYQRDIFSCLTESWVTGVDEFDCVVLYFNNATGYLAALHRKPCLGVFTLFAGIIFCAISKIQSHQQILFIGKLNNKICNRYNIHKRLNLITDLLITKSQEPVDGSR